MSSGDVGELLIMSRFLCLDSVVMLLGCVICMCSVGKLVYLFMWLSIVR